MSETAGGSANTTVELSSSREDITHQIMEIIVKEGMADEARVRPEATLKSLEIDSMSVVMVLMAIEEKFGVYIPMDGTVTEDTTLQQLIDNILDKVRSANGQQ